MQAMFQVKILNLDFTEKRGPYRKIIVKSGYLSQIITWGHIILGFFQSMYPLHVDEI
jgi:hypothetical protein